MKIQIPRDGLKAMLLFAANLDIRYYLQGVKVEATNTTTRLIATNGHILGIHHSAQKNDVGEPTELIVPRQAVELVRPHGPKGGLLKDVLLEQATDGWRIHDYTNGLRLGFDPIQGKFPDYAKVVPEAASGEMSRLNPAYVAVLAQAAKALKREPRFVNIAHNGNGAALARIDTVPEFLAVVMPMRDDFKVSRPEWLEKPLIAAPVPAAEAEAVPA